MATWDDYLLRQETVDGLRWTWNVLPHNRNDAHKLVVPIVAFFSPLKEKPAEEQQQPTLEYDPVLCKNEKCKAVLNPLCQVDFRGKVWICALCATKNTFPAHYAAASENNLPPELYPQLTTIEYTLKRAPCAPPVFLYVIDTCISSEEMDALKLSLQETLSHLPADAVVGLISFGRMVHLYDLSCSSLSRSYIFKGSKDIDQKHLKEILTGSPGQPAAQNGTAQTTDHPMPRQSKQNGVQTAPPPAAVPAFNKFLQVGK